MGSELLKMADGFALVADSLRELARQAVEEAEAETKQEGRTEKGIADKYLFPHLISTLSWSFFYLPQSPRQTHMPPHPSQSASASAPDFLPQY